MSNMYVRRYIFYAVNRLVREKREVEKMQDEYQLEGIRCQNRVKRSWSGKGKNGKEYK